MSDPDGGPIELTAAPLVEGAVAAAARARGGADLAEVAARGARGAADEVVAARRGGRRTRRRCARAIGDDALEATLAVPNRLGLHARPAGRFVSTVATFDATVQVENVTRGTGPADGRSLTALAVLARAPGRRPAGARERPAGGGGARRAARAGRGPLRRPARRRRARGRARSGRAGRRPRPPAPRRPPPRRATRCAACPRPPGSRSGPRGGSSCPSPTSPRRPRVRRTRSASGSITRAPARGRTSRPPAQRCAVPRPRSSPPTCNCSTTTRSSARRSGRSTAARRPASPGATPQRTPPTAFRGLDDAYLRERAVDVEDVARRVLAHLAGTTAVATAEPGIVLADELTPGEAAGLDPEHAYAIATARGGPTGHAAILARALGIPAVVGAGPALLAIADGTPLVLDGAAGTIDVGPGDDVVADAERRRDALAAERAAALERAAEPGALARRHPDRGVRQRRHPPPRPAPPPSRARRASACCGPSSSSSTAATRRTRTSRSRS